MTPGGDDLARDGRPGAPAARPIDAGHIVPVEDLSPATLRSIVGHLEVSTAFEHLVYREAELDAVWRLAEIPLTRAREPLDAREEAELRLVLEAARGAHDLVGAEQPRAAADRLRALIPEGAPG